MAEHGVGSHDVERALGEPERRLHSAYVEFSVWHSGSTDRDALRVDIDPDDVIRVAEKEPTDAAPTASEIQKSAHCAVPRTPQYLVVPVGRTRRLLS